MKEVDQRTSNNQLSDQLDDQLNDQLLSETLSAREAAEWLGVKLPTLYAYTSRGLVRSVAGEVGRARRYVRADLDRLRARRDARSGHGPVAAAALRFGEPVLDTAITEIAPGRGPLYRGRAATELADADVGFERVAELLWSAESRATSGPGAAAGDGAAGEWGPQELGLEVAALRELLPGELPPLSALSAVVPLLASRDPGRFVSSGEAILSRARVLIRRLSACLALASPTDEPRLAAALAAPSVADAVALALGSRAGEVGVRALNRALVLVADHELNASAFAARVAASTGADIYACVSAALAALSGPRHGGATERVEAIIAEIGRPEHVSKVVYERARRGESIEGFGHPLYPGGDPRGLPLLELAFELAPKSKPVATCLALVECAAERGSGGPTIDLGLVALASALGLPRGAAVGLFAIGRSAGWVAHAKEQYEAGYLVRPRARYRPPDPRAPNP